MGPVNCRVQVSPQGVAGLKEDLPGIIGSLDSRCERTVEHIAVCQVGSIAPALGDEVIRYNLNL